MFKHRSKPKPSYAVAADIAPGRNTHKTQLKQSLVGMTYPQQEAALRPGTSVQRKASGHDDKDAQPSAAGQFSTVYRNKHGPKAGKVTADRGRQLDYDSYKDRLGPIKASSETVDNLLPYQRKSRSAAQIVCPLSEDDFFEIFDHNYGANSMATTDEDRTHLRELFPEVNRAFRIMKLDTVGAQAAYLANAYWESAKFKYMTETEGSMKGPGYEKDPHRTKLNSTYLDNAAAGKEKVGEFKVKGYKLGGSINKKAGDWSQSFIGRGPVQVTHDYGYVQTLAVLEKRWEELKDAQDGSQEADDRALCEEALVAIKADPSQAANPKYAFLFAAAYMKRPTSNDLRSRPGDQLASGGSSAGFMGKQPKERGAEKAAVFRKAVEVLTVRQESWRIAHEDSDDVE